MTNNYNKFKIGQRYKSKTHPHKDLIIDYITDEDIEYESKSEYNYNVIVCWTCDNKEAFNDDIVRRFESKGKVYTEGMSTFPIQFAGECSVNSFSIKLKKYNLLLVT